MKLNIPGYKPAPQALPPSSFENYKWSFNYFFYPSCIA
jgi:hypothetical protein